MRNLITAEMANLLISLAEDSELWAQDNNDTSEEAERARIIAAEIQEVLAKEKKLSLSEDQAANSLKWSWRKRGH